MKYNFHFKILLENIEMKKIYRLVNKLVKENKIKFGFYNSQKSLDLLQLCYNKVNDTIEIEFRDVMSEYIQELRRIKNKE